MDHPRTKTAQVNMRISQELADRIDELADAEGRSRANWVERALERLVKKIVDRKEARG